MASKRNCDGRNDAPGTLSLPGEVDMEDPTAVRAVFAELATDTVVDCHGLTVLNSSAVEELVSAWGRLDDQGSTLQFVNVAPNVETRLAIVGLRALFDLDRARETSFQIAG